MMKRFNLFQKRGVPAAYVHAEWLEQQDAFRRQLLALPAEQAKRVGPKRITVAGRILTLALMQEIDKTKEERAKAAKETKALRAKRAKRKAKRRTCDVDDTTAKHDKLTMPPLTFKFYNDRKLQNAISMPQSHDMPILLQGKKVVL
ncbi:hypothetical protein DYB35_012381 [Aphanomyces astaci]|uniref:Uncharacterized protein n=1 Tax=Aphanomyces astaci TaxID=112090 RepID=A0A3R6XI69_APHAT|nr:hypothetical protein DYB35_012381 [Aphanomyces astaci]